jgi:LPXTG-site transpeptidase (sortase) family protein
VSFTATVTADPPGAGTPTGMVTFRDGGVNIAGCINQALVAGIATCNKTFAVVGSHSVTAVYSSDPNFLTSTSASVTELILPGLPNTSGLQSGSDAATPIPPEGIPSPWPAVLVLIASLGGLAILARWLSRNRVRFRQGRRHPAVGAIAILSCFVISTVSGSQLVTRPVAGSAPSRPATAVAGLPSDTEQIGGEIVTVAKPPPFAAQSFHPATGSILPSRLRIPSIGVDAPVVGVGLLGDGSMDAPNNLWTAAWLSSGARPGEAGSSVLAGHRGIGAPAVFSHLENVRPGERIFVSDAAGGELAYEVIEAVSIDLSPSAQVEVFGPTPLQRLVLITCFGKYLPSTRTYDHRLVVVARLLRSAP